MKAVYRLDVNKGMLLMCIIKKYGSKVFQEFSTLIVDVEFIHDKNL